MRPMVLELVSRTLAVATIGALAVGASSCGKSATAPSPSSTLEPRHAVTLTFESIEVITDGDPDANDAGELTFEFASSDDAGQLPEWVARPLSPGRIHTMNPGDSLVLGRSHRYVTTDLDSLTVYFGIRVTEWDLDGSGALVPDPAQSPRFAIYQAGRGAFNLGSYPLLVTGTSAEVRFRIYLEQTPAERPWNPEAAGITASARTSS